MRKILLIVVWGVVLSLAAGAPRMSIGELFGSHSCGSCRAAHAFLSAYRESFEDCAAVVEFHLDDDLQIDGVYERYNFYSDYYTMGYIPHMFINGENDSSLIYSWIIRMTEAADSPAVVGIEPTVHEFDSAGFKIFVDEDVAADYGITDADTYFVISVLVRDSVPYEDTVYNFVATRFYTDPNGDAVILAPGDTAEVGWSFDLDPGWDTTKCFMVVYVVGPELPYVANAYRLPVHRRPDYDFITRRGKPKSIAATDDTSWFSAELVNFGELDDTYRVAIAAVESCGEWDFGFAAGEREISVSLAPLDTETVRIFAVPHSVGTIKLALVFHTDHLAARYDTLYFAAASYGIDNFVVQDCIMCDSSQVIDFFAGRTDETSFYWNTYSDGEIGEFSLFGFQRIFWMCDEDTSFCLTPEIRAQLVNYVTSLGGKLFISGAGVGYRGSSDGGFYRIALGANLEGTPTAVMSVAAGDEVAEFSGWEGSFMGASRWESVSGQPAFGGQTAFYYNTGDPAGIVKSAGDCRVVYLGFSTVRLMNHLQFESLLNDAITFLDGGEGILEKRTPAAPTVCASPNPFNSSCRIEYAIDGSGIISIMDIRGNRLLRKKVEGVGAVIWSPKDVSSGVYLVEIVGGGAINSQKILLIK
ncbi:T9SS type A sorting domain-containing protein [bacterium]|nr:T9SS type A sorting domain-containing protein [bacterium]